MPRKTNKEESPKAVTFEDAFEKLNQVVQKLESSEGSLTDRTQMFEEGVQFSRLCSEQLDAIEQRVSILLNRDPEQDPVLFDSDEEIS